jgi:LPS export ABC transporter permease LptG/LPS export ABC transporter permease LptF
MLRTIDRYFIREILPPFVLALAVFTFILQIPPVMEVAEKLVAKGVPWPTIGRIMATLLPQALGITIPMAVLVGLLVGLGRLSADREVVALQACGVSVYRLLQPVLVVAFLGWALTTWILVDAMPRANQTYREIVYNIVAARAESEVRPRVFFEDFPNLVLYVRDTPPDGVGWSDVFLADTRNPAQPEVFVTRRGRMVLDREARRVDMVLEDGAQHRIPADDAGKYEVQRFQSMLISLDPETVFPRTGLQPGVNEMSLAELREEADRRIADGVPAHSPLMAIQKKFSIPFACFVFALLGLGLGVSSRKDSKQGSFVIAVAIIFLYYIFMYTGEAMAKAQMVSAAFAMWLPNLVLGVAGVALVYWRTRFAELGTSISIPLPFVRRSAPPKAEPANDAEVAPRPAVAARQPSGQRVVLVVRVPQFWLPQPRILDWYLVRLYARVFAIAFCGMLGIFYIATFIDLSDKVFKGQTTTGLLLELLYYSTPQFIYYVLPIAALIATLVTVGLMTKSSELTVMRACGISLYRTALPLLVVGALLSLVLFGLQETVLASANRRAQELNHIVRGGSPRTFDVLNRQWVAGRDGALYHYAFFDPRRLELNGLSIYRLEGEPWRLVSRTWVSLARYGEETWRAGRGWTRGFGTTREVTSFREFESATVDIEAADYFMTEQPDARRMNYAQLNEYIRELQTSGFNVVPHMVELQRKISFPFVTVVMTLLAVPFAVTTGKRGALFGIGVGIGLAISYWLLFSLFAAFGTAGVVAPALAAWSPNILFGVGAAYSLLTVRT